MAQQFFDANTNIQRLWCLCHDVVTGFRQYIGPDSNVRGGQEMAFFNRARDVSFNITQPQVRQAFAHLETAIPAWGSFAASNSVNDLAKSMACEQLLGYHYLEDRVKEAADQAGLWNIIYGTAAMLTTIGGNGDVHESAYGPDRIRTEPGIPNPDDSRFLAISRISTKADLQKQFPDKADAIAQAQAPKRVTTWWDDAQTMPPDRVEVLEVYCRSGHWFVLAGDGGAVLSQGFTPQRCMPVQVLRYTVLPDEFYGMGLVEQALPAQYAFTSSWNQILANMRLMSQPKILIPQNSGIAPDAFTARAGEKIYFRNAPPQPWQGQPLPQFAQQMPAAAQSTLYDMTAIHAASNGKRTPGLTTGVAMQTLMSADEMGLAMSKLQMQQAIERMGKVALLYMQAFYPPEKIMRQFDRYGSAIAMELRATDIADNPQVFVQADTLFASDVQARQERTMELMRMGAIPPDAGIKMLQRNVDPLRPQKPIADYVEARKALDAVVRQGFQAPDANKPRGPDGMPQMRKTVRFFPTDNFDVFAETVKQYMRSPEFDRLPLRRQDDVEQFYLDIIGQMQPATGAPPQQIAPLAQKPGLPADATPGVTPDNPGPGAIENTNERQVELADGRAEVAGAQ